ncbi:transposase [Agromyces mediolanus]|nr:transposase [Agromyces mediolanus]
MISDEVWAVIGPLLPTAASTGRVHRVDRRTVAEATAWHFPAGAPWRGGSRSVQ